ncbi:MAG: hypothetical protein UX08_C0001G0040 [Candidatus Collierbacteria bacterium GW2011_GWB1_45_35]|uniref:Uncharacterized protein n=2 Tax=Candidatus Collieribacteriota TaxID=1752725 RepID=A0A0G1KT33_9BACT|nr:MAG: hypothetical protein UW48_C0003G0037 [Microgenomates group bacterium GW2011_GWC1_44_23]KKT86728.1 MAG: hypothetical protein UW84_C0003G0010 [Candidatus Collierbacteria bacterium GW2011_GWA2_44_99]KKT95902.1 MAG: hypothetical protein UW96_C0003G0037 [Candidatus Collierbacteria bacterium GW2011_GWA1_45_15]KKU00994.1 MAG: hypothetical protein UX01_C0003G0047 [Candidatus Collierbacteria bacterium GW2011_GWB2_45_17]KKU05913.1 MAG: hypothetical protein UX08_C0001G0040 [Candidatus Collierbacte
MPNLDSLKKLINYHFVFITTAVLFVGLTVINLVGTNILATQGFAVSESDSKTFMLEKENQRLSVKIEESVRLSDLEEKAKQSGFIRSKSIVYLPTPPTFASR